MVSGHPPARNFNQLVIIGDARHYWSRDLDSAPREAVLAVCVSSFLAFYQGRRKQFVDGQAQLDVSGEDAK